MTIRLYITCNLLCLFTAISVTQAAEKAPPRFGVVGDSLATAAVANPEVALDISHLLRLWLRVYMPFTNTAPKIQAYSDPEVFGIVEPIEKVKSHFPSKDSSEDPGVSKFNESVLEVKEYSFGYMLGRGLGYKGSQIHFAAKMGTKIQDISRQFKELTKGFNHLPEKVVVSFNANDMCFKEVIETSPQAVGKKYYNQLIAELNKVIQNRKAHPEGTDVYYLASLDFLQLMRKKQILLKLVNFRGEPTFCYEVRQKRLWAGKLFESGNEPSRVTGAYKGSLDERLNKELLNHSLPGMCTGIFQVSPRDTEKIEHLNQVYIALLESQKKAIETIKSKAQKKGFNFHYIDETADIQFTAKDVSNDCFHPSVSGQEKVARTLLERIKN